MVYDSMSPITLKINNIYVLAVGSPCNRVSPAGSFNFFFSPPAPPPLEAPTKTCWAPLLSPSADVTGLAGPAGLTGLTSALLRME